MSLVPEEAFKHIQDPGDCRGRGGPGGVGPRLGSQAKANDSRSTFSAFLEPSLRHPPP